MRSALTSIPFLPFPLSSLFFQDDRQNTYRTSTQLAARTTSSNHHAGPSDPLSIRGAARPTPAGQFRSKNGETAFRPKEGAIDGWRQLVNKRYDPNTRFLNLEVRFVSVRKLFDLVAHCDL